MIFQGQEFLQGEWFQDTVPLDWDLNQEFRGIVRLYRDLIALRLDRKGCTRGLCGQSIHVFHLNDNDKLIAYRRWDEGKPEREVVVVANFANRGHEGYKVGLPREGEWKLRFNSDWRGYSQDFQGFPSGDVMARQEEYDGLPAAAELSIGPYSALIYSMD
jgi:1,4-alpha-glucan branching enzyme